MLGCEHGSKQRTGGGSTKSPRGMGTLTKTVYVGSSMMKGLTPAGEPRNDEMGER